MNGSKRGIRGFHVLEMVGARDENRRDIKGLLTAKRRWGGNDRETNGAPKYNASCATRYREKNIYVILRAS